jgi:hypothetical protein
VNETWRPVVGFEGHYEASDQGRVRGVDRILTTKAGQVRRQRGTVLRPALSVKGRLAVHLRLNPLHVTRPVHLLVLEAFVDPRPDGLVACHNDGDCLNNVLSNLRWDTPSANVLDAVRHGTHVTTRRTHWPRGHIFAPPNLATKRAKSGRIHRRCRACWRANRKAMKAQAAGRPPIDFDAEAHAAYARIMTGTARDD